MSFKNWTWWNKLITILGGLAAITALIDFFNKKISIIIPIYQWIIEKLNYPVPFYSILITIIGTVFILWVLSKLSQRSSTNEKTGVLPLNDDCEARYSYFVSKDGITLNNLGSNDGYTFYCSTHDLRLSKSPFGHEWLCPDPECTHQKRVGHHDFIISLIERQIRKENS